MAHANGTSTTDKCTATLTSDEQERPVIHVLMSDGRVTEFRSATIVVPESPRDEADTQVFGLLVNGRGEPYVDPHGNPVLLPAPPLVMESVANPDARLTWEEVADHAGVSLSSVKRAVQDGKLAPPQLLGKRSVRFRLAEVQAWLDSTRRPPRTSLDEWMKRRTAKGL